MGLQHSLEGSQAAALAYRLDAVLTDRQAAEASTPSPEPELSPPQKRKRAGDGPSEPSNGAQKPRAGAQRSEDSSDSGDSETHERWQPKEHREPQQSPESLPESRWVSTKV